MQLHLLKVPKRIIFKILTITFLAKNIHGKAPIYTCEQHTLRRELRLVSNAIMLKQPCPERQLAIARHCCIKAVELFACLTIISSFTKHLKTYLLREGYNQFATAMNMRF